MEDVLYDYHLAQGMLEQLDFDERDRMSQAYIDAVFEKHNITEADFDSSMVYYNRHANELKKIYQNIQERFTETNQELSLSTGNSEMTAVYSQNGDTANIWNAPTLIVLHDKAGSNFESFSVPTDSSFYKQDRFALMCNPILLRENPNDRDSYVVVGFTIRYKDGNTTAQSIRTNDSRQIKLEVMSDEKKELSSISGYFYYKSKDDFRNLSLISDIRLIRMHAKQQIDEKKDSLKIDSINIDTVDRRQHMRLTPMQLREQNKSGSHTTIKAAPDVRTPNSIGPRRRVARPRR